MPKFLSLFGTKKPLTTTTGVPERPNSGETTKAPEGPNLGGTTGVPY